MSSKKQTKKIKDIKDLAEKLDFIDLTQGQISSALSTNVDVYSRTIYLVGSIDDVLLHNFTIIFTILDSTPGDITIALSSPGGDMAAGFAMYDLIAKAHNNVTILGFGSVESAAVLIFQAAKCRILMPSTKVMVHDVSIYLGNGVSHRVLGSIQKSFDKWFDMYVQTLATRSGMSFERVNKMCRAETYMDAQEAVRMGLADSVLT